MKSREYYQFGSLTLKKRAKSADVWEFRYYEDAAGGGRERKALFIGTTDKYKTEAQARKAVEAILLNLNAEKPMHHLGTVTFGGLCDRYIAEELPERYSTRKSYLSNINLHIKPRWGEYLIGQVRPMAIEGWFKEMNKSPKTNVWSAARLQGKVWSRRQVCANVFGLWVEIVSPGHDEMRACLSF